MTLAIVSSGLWAAWVVSWIVAALWRRRATGRAGFADTMTYLVPLCIGGALMGYGGQVVIGGGDPGGVWRLWRLPEALCWALVGLTALGLAFTWWARITLGDLWSSAVTHKEGHVLIERGPYRFVRHPIYTGLLLAIYATAIEIGALACLGGAAMLTLGFWLKARLEERFLGPQLGAGAYADYRRRTPMLIPFGRAGR
jgi:protein-S-isoprenylcysteine O-methyltransferase Ste14